MNNSPSQAPSLFGRPQLIAVMSFVFVMLVGGFALARPGGGRRATDQRCYTVVAGDSGCNVYGCWKNDGGCNVYGCWQGANGRCNVYGCSDVGQCNVYGCPTGTARVRTRQVCESVQTSTSYRTRRSQRTQATETCNVYGCYSAGGGCNVYGCYSAGGGCNVYGCYSAGGGCNVYGCSNNGTCNVYGCP